MQEVKQTENKTNNETKKLKILGVDPGSRITGFSLVEILNDQGRVYVQHLNHGIIRAEETAFNQRVLEIGESFKILLKKYKPDHVILEKIFLGQNVDSSFKLGHLRGALLYLALSFNAEVYEYSTRVIKKGIAGNGNAEKDEVRNTLGKILNLDQIHPLDASDALALAVHHSFAYNKGIVTEAMTEAEIDI